MEHPDITCAMRTGYATFQKAENEDTPESRAEFLEDHTIELLVWLRIYHPELLDEYIDTHERQYKDWLN